MQNLGINTTDYPVQIKSQIENILQTFDKESEYLRNFQYIVKEYFIQSNNRGILLYHSPGVGKSILAASITEHIRMHDPKRKIVILLPKSLQANFEGNIRQYIKRNPETKGFEKSQDAIDSILENRYNFVSLNASNAFDQVAKIKRMQENIDFESKIKELNNIIFSNKNALENTLLIIDEFHHFSNSIKNNSKNGVKLYNLIMNTQNIKLVFLTATPVINYPFELVPTFNLLRGYIDPRRKVTLFSENPEDFEKMFLHRTKEGLLSIKNGDKFQNRIFGLVSYYGNYYFDKVGREFDPEQLPMIVEKVPMSPYQFARYTEVRDIEKIEEGNKFKGQKFSEKFSIDSKSKSSSSYRIRSRQVSNFFIPEYALEFKSQKRTSVTKYIDKLTDDDMKNLDKFSPKFKKMIQNIKKHPNQLGMVYSEFVSAEGIALFAKALEVNEDYVYWAESMKFKAKLAGDDLVMVDEKGAPSPPSPPSPPRPGEFKGINEKTYAIISGQIDMKERVMMLKIFNSEENKFGSLINLIIISKSGAEGLTLKNLRHIHIMEPFWNYALIEQVIGRGVRFKSHIALDKKDWNVQPYIYLSVLPRGYVEKIKLTNPDLLKNIDTTSTDEDLYFSSITNKKLIDDFNNLLIESSIDCSIHYDTWEDTVKQKFRCKLCAPTGQPLYDIDLYKDLQRENPCKPLAAATDIKVEEIKLKIGDDDTKEETFYYWRNPNDSMDIKLYIFNEKLNGYVPMRKDYPHYVDIIEKILFPS